MKTFLPIILTLFVASGCTPISTPPAISSDWSISIIPSSIRLDPSSNEIIEYRFVELDAIVDGEKMLQKNWVFDGQKATLYAARGEYISFQLVLSRSGLSAMKGIQVEMEPFKSQSGQLEIEPEIFMEWAVEIKEKSTGYPVASLGPGWYPDALIPYQNIQADSNEVHWRWVYPLEMPDFNNRIDNQLSTIFWIDQYIPFSSTDAPAGIYSSTATIKIGDNTKSIPIELHLWDFAIPNENRFRASLQHEGFLSQMDEERELEVYQLFKRNRVSLMDPTYKPVISSNQHSAIEFDWEPFDHRLGKYFTGAAFTSEYGYQYGPGYGEPIETFILPFNVQGKHGQRGWPDIGGPEVERSAAARSYYSDAISKIRGHLASMIDPEKTELTVYLNGLDESYFPEAWDRMVYYGDLFQEYYPEAHFRIDGGYSEEAMKVVKDHINSWASHTINYDVEKIKKYQEMGIEDWLYGPMLYETKVNSWVGSSTFLDLPLVNDRAISWSSWKYHTYSWISWGIGAGWQRAWYDPETWKDTYKSGSDSDENFTFKKLNGNGLLIYSPDIIPNVDVTCPSIRLKTMRDGVQEYEYMRLLEVVDGNRKRVDSIVNRIIKQPFGAESIGILDVWSFDPMEWDQARILIGSYINDAMKH